MTRQRPDCARLVQLFHDQFAARERTLLVRGEAEPLYLPREHDRDFDRLIFAHGFVASALHEIAHWCIAGKARRRLVDFGYWYRPEGRGGADQARFLRVEVKPQAVEWILSVAAGVEFHCSADNLHSGGVEPDPEWEAFQRRVHRQVLAYLAHSLPPRAAAFAEALAERFGTGEAWRQAVSYGCALKGG